MKSIKLAFGNGNIVLGVDPFGYIHAYETADSKKCGTNAVDFDPSKCVHHRIPVDSIVDCTTLQKKMSDIENRISDSFDFKGYTFDFTNYNEESVAVVRQTIEKSAILYTRLLAC